MSINGISYGQSHQLVDFDELTRREITNFNMADSDFDDMIACENSQEYSKVMQFLSHLAICHTIVTS